MLKYYPKILYQIDDFDYLKVSDISFYFKIKDFVSSFGYESGRPYTIQNGESPSVLSHKVYGTSRFDLYILIFNNIRNVYNEWPKSSSSFNIFLEEKYGSITYAKSNIANYYRSDGIKLSIDSWNQLVDAGKYTESYFEYESIINNAKSQIKLLDYNLMINFEVELGRLTNVLISQELNRNTL